MSEHAFTALHSRLFLKVQRRHERHHEEADEEPHSGETRDWGEHQQKKGNSLTRLMVIDKYVQDKPLSLLEVNNVQHTNHTKETKLGLREEIGTRRKSTFEKKEKIFWMTLNVSC